MVDSDKLEDLVKIASRTGYGSPEFKKAFEEFVQQFGYVPTTRGNEPSGDQTNGKRKRRRDERQGLLGLELPKDDDI